MGVRIIGFHPKDERYFASPNGRIPPIDAIGGK
jgi:hypothetical protein